MDRIGFYRASVPVQGYTLTLPIPILPYGPYSLSRASVPVQRCTLPLPTPLLPLWTVRPVQSLSACKTLHFTFTYTFLSLWTVRPVQSLSACTTVHFTFTYNSRLPMDRTACIEPQCLYNGALYLYLYLYSPYGPYGLYRASVPLQSSTLPLPKPLIPLWTVRPVQSFRACTKLHFNFTYTSTPPYGPYGLYRASVPVQRWTLHSPIPVPSLWIVQPLQSLSTFTTVHVSFTFTSIIPMDRTACT